MKKVIGFNVVFSGTLREVWVFLGAQEGDRAIAGSFALVPKSSADFVLLSESEREGEGMPHNIPYNIYEIRSTYSYGFDIMDVNGGIVEIQERDVGEFFVIDGLEQGAELKTVKGDEVAPCHDVTQLSSDSLFTIVGTYDDIHQAAVVELNNRISKVTNKLQSQSKE